MGKAKLCADQFTQPQLDDQHRVGRNETVNSRRAVSKMRAYAHFAITALFHSEQGILDTGYRLPLAKSYRVIHQTMPIFANPDHIFREVFRLAFIEWNFLAFVEINFKIVNNPVTLTGSLS